MYTITRLSGRRGQLLFVSYSLQVGVFESDVEVVLKKTCQEKWSYLKLKRSHVVIMWRCKLNPKHIQC